MKMNRLPYVSMLAVLGMLFSQGIHRTDVSGQDQLPKRPTPKRFVQQPLERLIATRTAGDQSDSFVNLKAEPGKVQWHEDMEMACRASRKSGKPVLLFQMIGRLDDRFC